MAAPVNDYAEALADPQVKHRGLVHKVDHQTSGNVGVVGPAWVLSRTRTEMIPPPVLGQHTEEILANWLGWTNEQIGRFRDGADQT